MAGMEGLQCAVTFSDCFINSKLSMCWSASQKWGQWHWQFATPSLVAVMHKGWGTSLLNRFFYYYFFIFFSFIFPLSCGVLHTSNTGFSRQSFLHHCFCLAGRITVMLDVLFFGLLAKQRSWPCLVIKNPQALLASRVTTSVGWPKSKKGYKFYLTYLKSLSISAWYFISWF